MEIVEVNHIYNTPCVNCETLEKDMVKVGVLHLCNDCFNNKFGIDVLENGGFVVSDLELYNIYTELYKKFTEK